MYKKNVCQANFLDKFFPRYLKNALFLIKNSIGNLF